VSAVEYREGGFIRMAALKRLVIVQYERYSTLPFAPELAALVLRPAQLTGYIYNGIKVYVSAALNANHSSRAIVSNLSPRTLSGHSSKLTVPGDRQRTIIYAKCSTCPRKKKNSKKKNALL